MNISGLHHVTAIAGEPQRNLDFYVGVLGLRLVKRTINFDDPGSYHFYFGDAAGSPGTILTFFPWANARRGARGSGEISATAYAIPSASVAYWLGRLAASGVTVERPPARFGEEVIRFLDPDGMAIELIALPQPPAVTTWNAGPVPAEHVLRGFHGVSALLDNTDETARLLTDTFGYRLESESGNRLRFAAPSEGLAGGTIDLVRAAGAPHSRSGAGSVHHIAFRVASDAEHLAMRETLTGLGYGVSPVMERTYFRSIYFREPGGILFEIATDTPGFAIDESPQALGESLRLPPWMEASRARIEEILPPIQLPRSEAP